MRSMLLRLRRVLQEVKLFLLISYFHFWGFIALSIPIFWAAFDLLQATVRNVSTNIDYLVVVFLVVC